MSPTGGLPFCNTRLVLQEELESDDYFTGFTTRLYFSPTSHPSVRQSLNGLARRCAVPAPAAVPLYPLRSAVLSMVLCC